MKNHKLYTLILFVLMSIYCSSQTSEKIQIYPGKGIEHIVLEKTIYDDVCV